MDGRMAVLRPVISYRKKGKLSDDLKIPVWPTSPVSDELQILTSVTAQLDAVGIPYMVTGSMAANYYATPRMTRDIDLVVELSEADVSRVVNCFQDEYYIDGDVVRQAIRNKSIFNMIHNALVVKVDCVVRKDSAYRREEFARR